MIPSTWVFSEETLQVVAEADAVGVAALVLAPPQPAKTQAAAPATTAASLVIKALGETSAGQEG
jgi:hypothetical protein